MKEQLWIVARFPDGSWSSGGRASSPEYANCEIFRVLATGRDDAEKKAKAEHRKAKRKAQRQQAEQASSNA